MAKRRKNHRKKHHSSNPEQSQRNEDFMPNLKESSPQEGLEEHWKSNPTFEISEGNFLSTSPDQNLSPEKEVPSPQKLNEGDELSLTEDKKNNPQSTQSTQSKKKNERNPKDHMNSLQEESSPVNSPETIGPYLRQQREEKNIHLKNIAQSTKISITNLENLEENHLDHLPNKAYVTGYVKSYAKLLGLNQPHCITILNKTYEILGKTESPLEIVIPQGQNSAHAHIRNSSSSGKILLLILALILASIFLVTQFGKNSKSPKEETSPSEEKSYQVTPQTLNEETPLQNKMPNEENPLHLQESAPPPPQEEMISNEKPQTSPEEKMNQMAPQKENKEELKDPKKESQKENEGENKEDEKKETPSLPKFSRFISPLYGPDTTMNEETKKELLPIRFRTTPQAGVNSIYITAVEGSSWLTYKSDDAPIKKFVLEKGRSLLIQSKLTRLFLGNLKAVKIFLDNKPLQIYSRSHVKSLVFPQERAKDFLIPLFIYNKNGTVVTSEEYQKEKN